MKFKSVVIAFTLVLATLVSSFSVNGYTPKNFKNKAQITAVSEEIQTVTVGQMADFLANKKEHYPFSDQFMERYQQTSGGYLDNAKKAGILVDRTQHSPNQKWHFFESWYYPSIEDGTLSRDDDAKSRIYTKLYCPELLLWIYEACGVAPYKVRNAMRAAENGKSSGSAVTSIAKNMRACVSWEDLLAAFLVKVPATSVSLDKTELEIKVGETASILSTVSPSNATDAAVWSIVEGNGVISLTQKSNQVSVVGLKDGVSKIKVTYNEGVFAECVITVIKADAVEPNPNPNPEPSEGAYNYAIVYDLGTRKTAKLIEDEGELLNAFSYLGEGSSLISSVKSMEYIYGGANGGRGDTAWLTGDVLKFGTTGVKGSLSLELSAAINYIRITGYVHASNCKISVNGVVTNCSNMSVASKEVVDSGQTSTFLVVFEDSTTLTIANLNSVPLYITAIEIG